MDPDGTLHLTVLYECSFWKLSLSRSYLPWTSWIKVLLVKQIAHFDFPLVLFFEITINFFDNVLPVCFYSFYNTYACFCNLKKPFWFYWVVWPVNFSILSSSSFNFLFNFFNCLYSTRFIVCIIAFIFFLNPSIFLSFASLFFFFSHHCNV